MGLCCRSESEAGPDAQSLARLALALCQSPFNNQDKLQTTQLQPAPRPCVLLSAGHLVEALMSKVGAIVGSEGDATPFTDVTVENISNTLHA